MFRMRADHPATRLRRRSIAAMAALCAAVLAVSAQTAAASPAAYSPASVPIDTGITVTASGVVSQEAGGVGAYEPALTRAANGDLVAAYPTTSDSAPNGVLRLTRSTDGGATWTTPVTLYTPHVFTGGSVVMSVGMTTLADGTILLPFNEGVNYSQYRNRDSVLYVAKSTDNGKTWSGLDTPVQFPVPVREQWAYGKILQLGNGDLVLPLWGSRSLAPDWQKNPTPWNVAVLRSHDGGATWTEYSTVATDKNLPPSTAYSGGPNETTVSPLADGRLLAIIRFASPYPGTQPVYLSYSSNGGRSWSAPQASTLSVQSPSAALTPCTASLPKGDSKIVLGYRNMTAPYAGAPVLSVSYDNGLTWQGKMFLQDPGGTPLGGYIGSYPAFTDLGNGRTMVIFMEKVGSAPYRVAYNILQDASATDCQAASSAVQTADASTISVFVQRSDRDAWPFPYALKQLSWPSTTVVSNILAAAASAATCSADGVVVTDHGRRLNPRKTLAQNHVRSGDVLTVSGTRQPHNSEVAGLRDLDVYPDDAPVAMWSDRCDYRAALDASSRSLGIKTPGNHKTVASVNLRGTSATTRLTDSTLTLWASSDNKTYTQVTGWTLTKTVGSDGRLVLSFTGLSISQRYIKVHQAFADASYTFLIASMRDDVWLTYAR